MSKTFYTKIPFDLEKAKKIVSGEMKGEIVTRDNLKVRILAFDLMNEYYPIVAANKIINRERLIQYTNDGRFEYGEDTEFDLFLRIPTYSKDYSNFKPQVWQPCIVRDYESEFWEVKTCAGYNGEQPLFYHVNTTLGNYASCPYNQYLPISKVTEHLIGTNKSYEQLIKELDSYDCKD